MGRKWHYGGGGWVGESSWTDRDGDGGALLFVASSYSCNHDAGVSFNCGFPATTEEAQTVPEGRLVPPGQSRQHKCVTNTATSKDTHMKVGLQLEDSTSSLR